jgi:hypothetical protein
MMYNSIKSLGKIPVDPQEEIILETGDLGEDTYEYDIVLDNFIHRTNSYLNDVQAGKANPAYGQKGVQACV